MSQLNFMGFDKTLWGLPTYNLSETVLIKPFINQDELPLEVKGPVVKQFSGKGNDRVQSLVTLTDSQGEDGVDPSNCTPVCGTSVLLFAWVNDTKIESRQTFSPSFWDF